VFGWLKRPIPGSAALGGVRGDWTLTDARSRALDVITLGRSGIDLYGEQLGARLEDMSSFAKYVGGSPTNTAIGASRLGLRSGLISRVGADHLGRFILQSLQREGVDTTGVSTDPRRLTALAILGILDKDTFPLIFYREDCADMAIKAADIDVEWLLSAGALVLSGTHLSQSDVFAASIDCARKVRATGGKVAFDVDYRPVLWGLASRDMGEERYITSSVVTARMSEAAKLCDLIVGTEDEMRILGGAADLREALASVRRITGAVLVCKLGARGCAVFEGVIPKKIEDGLTVPGFPVDVVNVLGAGDAFSAGFLRGWLKGENWQTCGRWGNACGAIVVSRHSCAPAMPTFDEMQAFISARHPLSTTARALLDHQHWARTRHRTYRCLMVLAVDHRLQFEELAKDLGVSTRRITAFKRLAFNALQRVAQGDGVFGILLDGRYGAEGLRDATRTNYWTGRAVEIPKSRPLRFETAADVGLELNTWPADQVVKCLVTYHPDDEPELRAAQEHELVILFDACRKSRHELLLEVILPTGMPADAGTRSRALGRLYELGIKPDWWKLEPVADVETWENIEAIIEAHDPFCRGVVLLGLAAPEPELLQAFAVAAKFKCVKGFAVGRTVFQDVAGEWLRGTIDDEAAIRGMAAKFGRLAEGWRTLRSLPSTTTT
jgi:5-dehydro-2-deoxygluconokinase